MLYSNKSITVSLTSSFFFRVFFCCCYSVLLTNYPFRYRDNCTNYHKKLYLNCFHPTATRHCVCCYLYLVPLKKEWREKGVSGIKKPYFAAFFGKWVDFLSESKILGRWLPAKGIILLQKTQMIKRRLLNTFWSHSIEKRSKSIQKRITLKMSVPAYLFNTYLAPFTYISYQYI